MGIFRGPNIIRDGLVLALDGASIRSNPKTGTTWYDISGNGNNFTLSSPTVNSGDSINFSNSSAREISSTDDYNNTSELTMDTWFYYHTGGVHTGCCDTVFGRYHFRTFIIGNLLYTMIGFDNGSGVSYQHPNVTVSPNQWNHMVSMRRNDRFVMVLNGTTVHDSTYGSGLPLANTTAAVDFAGSNRHSDLRIGAARIWNRGLSDDELTQNFNAEKNRFGL